MADKTIEQLAAAVTAAKKDYDECDEQAREADRAQTAARNRRETSKQVLVKAKDALNKATEVL